MPHRSHDLPRGLVLALPLIRHLSQEVVFGPRQVGHFHDQLRPHPMHRIGLPSLGTRRLAEHASNKLKVDMSGGELPGRKIDRRR
jgi:hypothetical protein